MYCCLNQKVYFIDPRSLCFFRISRKPLDRCNWSCPFRTFSTFFIEYGSHVGRISSNNTHLYLIFPLLTTWVSNIFLEFYHKQRYWKNSIFRRYELKREFSIVARQFHLNSVVAGKKSPRCTSAGAKLKPALQPIKQEKSKLHPVSCRLCLCKECKRKGRRRGRGGCTGGVLTKSRGRRGEMFQLAG